MRVLVGVMDGDMLGMGMGTVGVRWDGIATAVVLFEWGVALILRGSNGAGGSKLTVVVALLA